MKISAVVPQLRTRNLDSTIRFYTKRSDSPSSSGIGISTPGCGTGPTSFT
ncbi:MAG: hypothetical protein R2882_10875 [Gemmatimonadales bacterium]